MSRYTIKENTDNWFFCTTSESKVILEKIAKNKNIGVAVHTTNLGWPYMMIAIRDLDEFEKFRRVVEQYGYIQPIGKEMFEFPFREEWEHRMHEKLRINGIELFEYEEVEAFIEE